TWDNLVDWGGPTPDFDFSHYLDFLRQHNHNFIRLWVQESTRASSKGASFVSPLPWQRTGPGEGNDGQPKFDLTRFNEEYFKRLRARVMQASSRGIYVSIMLFNRFIDWRTHPLNPANNINGINGDANGDGDGREIHTSTSPEVNAVQLAYVKKVVGTVNDLDNVLFEIGNELRRETLAWQYSMIRLIHDYEKQLPKQHPVGMTSAGGDAHAIANAALLNSRADWVSLRSEPGQDYSYEPPAGDGKKVIISDTDHLIGQLGEPTPDWVWKSFLRGLNPILMDVIQNPAPGYKDPWNKPDHPFLKETRLAMGQTLYYANRIDLAKMIPAGKLASTGYCLANPGFEYLVYLPGGSHSVESFATSLSERLGSHLASLELFARTVSVQLAAGGERFEIEWFNPATGKITPDEPTVGRGPRQFTAPFRGDAVLYIRRSLS
ncbi:MAG: DUF6298 domain-containing protein, partial [Candidatus Binatia bacterium]